MSSAKLPDRAVVVVDSTVMYSVFSALPDLEVSFVVELSDPQDAAALADAFERWVDLG